MQHKCKMTVLDKKLYPELQAQYCADPEAGPCPSRWGTSTYLNAMDRRTTSGAWERGRWQPGLRRASPGLPGFPTAPRRGTLSAATFTQPSRVGALCGAG